MSLCLFPCLNTEDSCAYGGIDGVFRTFDKVVLCPDLHTFTSCIGTDVDVNLVVSVVENL